MRFTSKGPTRFPAWFGILMCCASFETALADTIPFSYSGRLTEANGRPVSGTIDVVVSFYSDDTAGTLLGSGPQTIDDVPLKDGVFQVTLNLDSAEYHDIFVKPSEPVWIQITDGTHNKTYPRQPFAAVPFALKVPVDGTTVTWTNDGKLSASSGSGTITGVTAGTGLTGGGTSGGVTLNLDYATIYSNVPGLDAGGNAVVTSLDASVLTSGTLPLARMPITGLHFVSVWNANTNTPTLNPASCNEGDYYIVSVSGGTNLDGNNSWAIGDWAICGASSAWQKVGSATAGVSTVNGQSGPNVVLTTTEVTEGTSQYFTTSRAKAATLEDAINDGTTDLAPSQDAVFDALATKQGLDSELTALAGLTPGNDAFVVGNGSTFVTASGASARSALGLSSMAQQSAGSVAITGGSITGITDLPVSDGGTGAGTALAARGNLGAAASGANSDITSLSGLSTPLSVAQGGSGASTLNGILKGNGTGAFTVATPGIHYAAPNSLAASDGVPLQAVLVDASGNVGIGTTTPNDKLHVRQSLTSPVNSVVDTYFTGNQIFMEKAMGTEGSLSGIDADRNLGGIYFGGFDGTSRPTSAIVSARSANAFTSTNHATYLNFYTTGPTDSSHAERMRISPTGNVGIGTVAPGAKLVVVGEARTVDSAGSSRLWGQGRPNSAYYGTTGAGTGLCTNGAVSFGLSLTAVFWDGAAAACPAGTWVCTEAERGTGACNTARLDDTADASDCSGAQTDWAANAHQGWVLDADATNNTLVRSAGENGVYTSRGACNAFPVWCCSQ